MVFSGIPFLFYFLPVVLVAYFLVPKGLKNGLLLVSSLLFYAWGEPVYVVLMIVAIVSYYLLGLGIGHGRCRKALLVASVLLGVGLLAVFKYADFFIGSVNALLGTKIPTVKLALPIGISFYTFQCMSYTIDVYRGDAQPQKSLVDFGAYVSMFPQLIAGPIVRYVDVAKELQDRPCGWDNVVRGLPRFLVGLGKKILLANQFAVLVELFRGSSAPSVLFYWLYAVAFTLQIYFDFSGYSDMAIGLGRIFGFNFPENFDYPYISGSVTEFWRRWHMTLGGWFRDYVYIPLGGNRVSTRRWVRNILAVWMLTGLWHGAAWNFVLWGLLFAVLLLLEKWVPGMKQLPGALRHVYVMGVVVLSFVIFNAESFRQLGADFAGLFGAAGLPLITGETLYHLRSFGVVLAAGILGATPLVKGAYLRLGEGLRSVLEPAALAVLLVVCTAYLVDGSFDPFLYFRF